MTPPARSQRPGFIAAALPSSRDPRWRVAPRAGTEAPEWYLPFAPPFVPSTGARLRWLRRQTRLVLLADGFPGRLRSGRVLVHPLDGRYLLEALLAEQAERPRRRLHLVIARTAAAVVRRAEPVGDALLMRYVDTASSMAAGQPHPSGLAQAYYAAALARAAAAVGDEDLARSADRFFNALLVPVNEGGVLYRAGPDLVPAIVPTKPRDLVLNGWLSSLVAIHAYGELRDSQPARDLIRASLRTLLRLLPAYDVPALHLSRYGLTGPILLRIGFGGSPDGVRVSRLRVAIPGEGEYELPSRTGSRWVARAYPEDAAAEVDSGGRVALIPRARGLRAVAILSRAPYPRRNRLRFHVRSPREMSVTLTAHIGRYDPQTSATIDRSWVSLGSIDLRRGSRDVDFELPYEQIELFAYPTNFTRGGPGSQVNTYHGTHVLRLRQLAAISGLRELEEWADRWLAYTKRWSGHPDYADGVCWTPEGLI
jgi:hypothetical protein